jgi:hypothetical protein
LAPLGFYLNPTANKSSTVQSQGKNAATRQNNLNEKSVGALKIYLTRSQGMGQSNKVIMDIAVIRHHPQSQG